MFPLFRPLATSSNVTAGTTSAQSAVAPAGVFAARILNTSANPAAIQIGTNPTATANDMVIAPQGNVGSEEFVFIRPGERIAAIRTGAADATLNITWITR